MKIVTGPEMRLITLKSIFTDIITHPRPDLHLSKKIASVGLYSRQVNTISLVRVNADDADGRSREGKNKG